MDHARLVHGVGIRQNLQHILLDEVEIASASCERLGFDYVVMTRRYHGDVWIVNRSALGLSSLAIFYYKTAFKYGRGIGRIVNWAFAGMIRRAA